MKNKRMVSVAVAVILAAGLSNVFVRAQVAQIGVVQIQTEDAAVQGLRAVPSNAVPESGTFWSLANSNQPPIPFFQYSNVLADVPVPVYAVNTNGAYLVDDRAAVAADAALTSLETRYSLGSRGSGTMTISIPSPPDGGGDTNSGSGGTGTSGENGPQPNDPQSGSAVAWAVRLDATGAALSWPSASNVFYQIQFKPDLSSSSNSWFILDDGYPSQGTNTFWKDTGFYGLVSAPSTTDASRFYKIIGFANSPTPPSVSINVPTGVLSGTVSINVSVVSTAAVMAARLYVDGGKVDEIDGTGTFQLDTTQFTDGTHTIFAAAENESGFCGTDEGTNSTVGTTGYGLSAFATRTFTNGSLALPMNSPQGGSTPLPVTNTFGIMYQGNHPSWLDLGPNVNWPSPWNGINQYVLLPNQYLTPRPYGPIRASFRIADGFVVGLGRVGHQPKFFLADQGMAAKDYVRSPQWGGVSKFNEVNFGFLIGHGARGATYDYTAGLPGVRDTYYPVWHEGDSFYDWVALSQCDFGSANLRWMAILTCNNLAEPNLDDLYNQKFANELIVNGNLHLLLGSGSAIYMVSNFGRVFADACVKGTNGTPMSIREAWFYAGTRTQGINNPHPELPVYFTVVGWPSCWDDTLYSFTPPDTSDMPQTETRQVYPSQ